MNRRILIASLTLAMGACGETRVPGEIHQAPQPESDLPPVPSVAIEGYGARLVFHPPFMINRVPAGPNGRPDQLLHAHPDASGIRNLMIIPSVPSGAPLEVRRIDGRSGFEVAPDGTQVHLGSGMTDLEGVADFGLGPSEASWTIASGETRVPWPTGKLLRSSTSGLGYELVDPPAR